MSIPTMADVLGAVNSGHGGYRETGEWGCQQRLAYLLLAPCRM